MTIRKCDIRDKHLLNEFMRSDAVFPLIQDDVCSSPDKFDVAPNLTNPLVWWMSNDDEVFGMFEMRDLLVFEAHVFCSPNVRGRGAIQKAKDILRWMYINTTCKKMMGFTPAYHKAAIHFSKWVGFEYTGTLKDSLLKDGEWHDEIISQHDWRNL